MLGVKGWATFFVLTWNCGPLEPCLPEIQFFRPTRPVLYDQSLTYIGYNFICASSQTLFAVSF